MASIVSEPASGIARRVGLRTALKLGAAVTSANAAAYLLAAEPLGGLFGLSPALLRLLGAIVLAFAAGVWWTATRSSVPRPPRSRSRRSTRRGRSRASSRTVGGWTTPTTVGTLWIVAQAIVVAAFAGPAATGPPRPT